MRSFHIGCIRRRRRQIDAGVSSAAAADVDYRQHHTHRIHGGVAIPQSLVVAVVVIVTFLLGILVRVGYWYCLLFKISGEPFFSRIDFQRVSFENPNNEYRDRIKQK